jgi:hypothetical protein
MKPVHILLGFALAAALAIGLFQLSAVGQQRPHGLAVPTSTPDLRSAATRATAEERLSQADPALGKLIEALRNRDSEGVLAVIDWQKQTCGSRRDLECGSVPDGETVEVVNAGWPVAFYVTAEILRPSLEQLLSGDAILLRFASHSLDHPDMYFLGFESAASARKGLAPLTDPSNDLTGIFVTADASKDAPVVLIEFSLSRQYSAVARAGELGFDRQDILLFDESTAVDDTTSPPQP